MRTHVLALGAAIAKLCPQLALLFLPSWLLPLRAATRRIERRPARLSWWTYQGPQSWASCGLGIDPKVRLIKTPLSFSPHSKTSQSA
jgi:hypothetical protein